MQMTNNIKLSIVVPCHNNWRYTKSCLEDLSNLPDDHEVVLIDDGSTDLTEVISKGNMLDVKSHKNTIVARFVTPHGFAQACNMGFAKSFGDYVMFLNNDIKVLKDKETWTQPILEVAQDGALVGPTVGVLDQNLKFLCEATKLASKGFNYMSGWNVTAKKETWRKLQETALGGEVVPGSRTDALGPFSCEFGRAYFEDTDMGLRALQQGIPMVVVPNVPVRHFGKMTTKKIGVSKHYAAAREVFLEKWQGKAQGLLGT